MTGPQQLSDATRLLDSLRFIQQLPAASPELAQAYTEALTRACLTDTMLVRDAGFFLYEKDKARFGG